MPADTITPETVPATNNNLSDEDIESLKKSIAFQKIQQFVGSFAAVTQKTDALKIFHASMRNISATSEDHAKLRDNAVALFAEFCDKNVSIIENRDIEGLSVSEPIGSDGKTLDFSSLSSMKKADALAVLDHLRIITNLTTNHKLDISDLKTHAATSKVDMCKILIKQLVDKWARDFDLPEDSSPLDSLVVVLESALRCAKSPQFQELFNIAVALEPMERAALAGEFVSKFPADYQTYFTPVIAQLMM